MKNLNTPIREPRNYYTTNYQDELIDREERCCSIPCKHWDNGRDYCRYYQKKPLDIKICRWYTKHMKRRSR